MEVKATFDESGFSTRIATVTSQLESDYESYVKATMKSEAQSASTSGLDATLSDFKKSVVPTPRTTFPEEVYTALMQQYVVNAPEVKEINGELVKAFGTYIADILEDHTQVVPTGKEGKEKYTVAYNFGALLDLATVTDPNGKSYTVSWKSDEAQNSYLELLGNIKDYGKNQFEIDFWTSMTSDVAGNFIDDVFNVVTYYSEKAVTPVINYLKFTKAIDEGSTELLLGNEGVTKLAEFLNEQLFSKIFSTSNKTITNAQKQYKTLLQRKSALLNDLGDGKDVASLSSYKKFVTAFNDLQTTIGQSQTSFDSIINEYTTYEFSDVANSEIDENRALINGNDDANVIIANGYSVTLNGNGGDDTLVANGANALVSGGLGNDSIMNTGYQDTLNGDEGDDLIIVEGNSSSVNGGAGKDKIIVNGSDVTVDGGSNFDSLPVPDIIRIETEAKNVVVKNFENADSLDLSIYNADELSAGKYQTNSVTIYSRKTYETIVILEDVTSRSSNNILCKAESGEVTAVSIDWLLENTPPIVNPYETVKPDDGEQTGETVKPDDEANSKIINGKNGGDTINNDRDGMTINLAAGNNSVENSGKSVTINGSADKDTVTNSGDSVVIYGNADDDFINSQGDNTTIDGGSGNNRITNSGMNVTISNGNGDNIIENSGQKVSIDGGMGNNYINNGSPASSVSMHFGDGNNKIFNYADAATIFSGKGDDTVTNYDGAKALISVGNGNNSVKNGEYVNGRSIVGGANITILSGAGKDKIENHNLNASIISGAGNDSISNIGDSVTIDGGDDNDSVSNYGVAVIVDLSAGDDYFWSYRGNHSSIDGGAGNDTITNSYGKNVSINGGDGNNSISNGGDNATILAGNGDDYIQSSGDSVLIDCGNGNNTIAIDVINEGSSNLSIFSGAGSDSICGYYVSGKKYNAENITISSGSGNDNITNGYDKVSIDAGADNDYISNSGYYVTINGGDGNDTIANYVYGTSIIGGKGNDSICLDITSYYGRVIQYTSGDGNDIINGFRRADTLNIAGGSYTTQTSGNNVIVKVGDGSITLKDAKGLSLNIKGTLDTTKGGSSSTSTTTGGDSSSTTKGGSSSSSTTSGGSSSSTTKGGSSSTSTTTGGGSSSTTKGGSSSTSTTTSTTPHNTTTSTPTTTVTTPVVNQHVYAGGNQVIANYNSGEKIIFDGIYTGATYDAAAICLSARRRAHLALRMR